MKAIQVSSNVVKHRSSLMGGMCCAFIVFCLFPYLRIIPLKLDAQPNAMILSIPIIMVFLNKCATKEIAMLLFVLLAAFLAMIFSNANAIGIRAFANYVSLFLVSYASYLALCYSNGLPYNLFRCCVYVWFAVGFIQTFFDSTFGDFLIFRGAVTEEMQHGRGVCSLAVEPTYYGMICVFMAILNYLNFRDFKYYRQLSILIFVQLIFSKSTTVFLFLGLSVLVYCMYQGLKSRKGIIYIFAALIGLVIFDYTFRLYLDSVDSRLTNAIRVLYDNPDRFLLMDYSVNNRFMHAFFPIKAFFDDWGMPHGLARFNDYLIPMSKDPEWGYLLPYDYSEEYRINSAISGALYDLGVFALPILWVLYKCLRGLASRGYNGLFCGIVLICMMLNNMPFSQAILPFIFGNLIYLYRSRRNPCPDAV